MICAFPSALATPLHKPRTAPVIPRDRYRAPLSPYPRHMVVQVLSAAGRWDDFASFMVPRELGGGGCEILLEEFLRPLGVSQYHLAKQIGVSARRINEIVHGQRRISADTALRLARFFGTSERFWINLQARYDLDAEKDRLGDTLDAIRPLRPTG